MISNNGKEVNVEYGCIAQLSKQNETAATFFLKKTSSFLIWSMVLSVPGPAELARFVIRCHSFCLS